MSAVLHPPYERANAWTTGTTTLREYLLDRMNQAGHAWMTEWFIDNPYAVIIRRGNQTTDCKMFNVPMTGDIDRIGWSGLAADGLAAWVGFDFDIGHGVKSYPDQYEALKDAVRLWDILQGEAEIRTSTGGVGLHVRHKLRNPLSHDDARSFVKGIADCLSLRVDPTPLGRQAFWFWQREHQVEAFRQIMRTRGGHWDD